MPTRDEFLSTFHRDAALFEAAVRAGGDLGQPIDGCPDWSLATLVGHIGSLHRFINTGIEVGDPGPFPAAPDNPDAYADWFADGAATLEATLRARADDEPCWTFFSNAPQVVGTWVRRMTQELAVHRYDAELAATGTAETIDAALAKDGIDEFFDLFLGRVDARRPIRVGDLRVQLRTLDTEPEAAWMVHCSNGPPVVTREHGQGDVALLGAASALLLALWGRVGPGEMDLELYGSPEDWARFHEAASI